MLSLNEVLSKTDILKEPFVHWNDTINLLESHFTRFFISIRIVILSTLIVAFEFSVKIIGFWVGFVYIDETSGKSTQQKTIPHYESTSIYFHKCTKKDELFHINRVDSRIQINYSG